MKIIQIICSILLLNLTTIAQNTNSQEINYKDIVKLNDGSEFIGTIKQLDEVNITMLILGGHEIKIPRTSIKNIKQKCYNCKSQSSSLVEKKKNFYYQLNTGAITGNNNLGGSFTNSFGYTINSKFSTGIGIGIQSFGDYSNRINTIPLFLESKYLFTKNVVTPFCQVQGGYGFANLNDNAKGGLYYQPSIGVAFRKNSTLDFNISIGFLSQKMTYKYPTTNDIFYNYITGRDLSIRRWVIQGGITF